MKLSYKQLCLGILCTILGFSALPAEAQTGTNNYRKIGNDEIQRFADHTFWKTHKLDRMYFNSDGSFIQQLNDDWNGIDDGTMLTGQWEVKDDSICWNYDEKTVEAMNTSPDPFCYTVLTNSPADNFMTTHMESFRLYAVGEETQRIAFEWNRYAYDNYILDPEYVQTVKDGMKKMAEYRRSGYISGGTISKEELTDPWMQHYYDETVNRVFFIADQSMYFNDKGLYFFINDESINNANGDIEKMKSNGTFGRWQMKDNIHCWYLSENRSSCEFLMPEGKGLIRPYTGMFGIFYTGFTRVHGEMATGHLDTSDTSAPALFDSLANTAP